MKHEFYTKIGKPYFANKKQSSNIVYCQICKEWVTLPHTTHKEVKTNGS